MRFRFRHYNSLDSTNSVATRSAREGADEGLCIVADEQTAGRGRQGREWTSQKGSGVYMSVVLRPKLDAKHLTLIPLMAAVAVYEVLVKGFAIKADIKWPNDVLVGDKKICGILSEAIETPQGLAVILGIGVNLKNASLPENATSIEAESTVTADRDEVVGAVAREMASRYDVLHTTPAAIIDEWKQRSTYYDKKAVEVRSGSEAFEGITCGLEESGALRVRTSNGIRIIQAGDVERLRSGD